MYCFQQSGWGTSKGGEKGTTPKTELVDQKGGRKPRRAEDELYRRGPV